jgi:hypothetical protein
MIYPLPEHFPGTLYDGDGKRLAGAGPDFSPALEGSCSFKAVLYDLDNLPPNVVMRASDRLWLLPDDLGSPPQLPYPLLSGLASIIRNGGKVGLMARDKTIGAKVQGVIELLMSDPRGRA